MPEAAVELDVLIVGAGPVGLFLANECERRGLRWRIVETRSGQSVHSKALAIFPRTLEIFDMAGIAASFLEAANRVTSVSLFAQSRRLAHMPFEPGETPYPFIAMVPQDVTEKLLLGELRRKGGDVLYETTFVSAEASEGSVTATLEHGGARSTVSAAFLVGCDGAHSAVRHGLGIPFEGAAYEDSFLLADVETNDALPADELQLCPNEHGPAAIFPMSAVRRRIVATCQRPEGDAPSLEMIRRILAERAPRELEAKALYWSSYFRIHHRHVAHLRVGRQFLAGDAAHIHSPFGGQGMNTGLHDVWNLVWKLDLVVHGRGHPRLLDSYEAERLPVIRNVIAMTDAMTRVFSTPNRFVQALRDTVIPMVSRLAPFQHAFVQRLSELGIAYPESPIVEGPGKRYLDDAMRGGRGIGSRFLLVLHEDAGPAERAAATDLCRAFPGVLECRKTARPGLALIRPDGYVAYSATALGGDERAHVRAVLERQITNEGVSSGDGSGRTPPSP